MQSQQTRKGSTNFRAKLSLVHDSETLLAQADRNRSDVEHDISYLPPPGILPWWEMLVTIADLEEVRHKGIGKFKVFYFRALITPSNATKAIALAGNALRK